jgi:hypothetical protein
LFLDGSGDVRLAFAGAGPFSEDMPAMVGISAGNIFSFPMLLLPLEIGPLTSVLHSEAAFIC